MKKLFIIGLLLNCTDFLFLIHIAGSMEDIDNTVNLMILMDFLRITPFIGIALMIASREWLLTTVALMQFSRAEHYILNAPSWLWTTHLRPYMFPESLWHQSSHLPTQLVILALAIFTAIMAYIGRND